MRYTRIEEASRLAKQFVRASEKLLRECESERAAFPEHKYVDVTVHAKQVVYLRRLSHEVSDALTSLRRQT